MTQGLSFPSLPWPGSTRAGRDGDVWVGLAAGWPQGTRCLLGQRDDGLRVENGGSWDGQP